MPEFPAFICSIDKFFACKTSEIRVSSGFWKADIDRESTLVDVDTVLDADSEVNVPKQRLLMLRPTWHKLFQRFVC